MGLILPGLTDHFQTGVPYCTVSVELDLERVVIKQSSFAPGEFRWNLESLAHNPLAVVEDLGDC